MRLKRRELKAILESMEMAERYKPFQVAKRKVMEKYGLLGSRADRLATALLYKMYRLQGVLDDVVAEVLGVEVRRLPAYLRQSYRLAAYLALYDTGRDSRLAEQLLDYAARVAAARFSDSEAERVEKLYRVLRGGKWSPSRDVEVELRLLLPPVIVKRLFKLLGSMDEVERFASAVNNPNPIYGLRVNTLKTDMEEVLKALEEIGVEAWPSRRVSGHIRYRGGLPYERFQPLREGKVVPQDESSAAAAPLLSPRPGARVADLCAAPGGKTTHIAELQRNRGNIIALELYGDRISRLVDLARRTGTYASINPVIGDALRASTLVRRADSVLLDPPCSSTGAIARHPEARWRLTERVLRQLAARQYRMLKEAVALLPSGGRLLYTVCSVMPEEGEYLISRALEELPVSLVPLHGPYDASPLLPGTMRAWPHRHGTTGFFYALLERR